MIRLLLGSNRLEHTAFVFLEIMRISKSFYNFTFCPGCLKRFSFFLSSQSVNSLCLPLQDLQLSLAEHQGEVDYLNSAVEQVFQKAPPDISMK